MKIFWAIFIFCIMSSSSLASIGQITKADGPSKITRETGIVDGTLNTDILSMDRNLSIINSTHDPNSFEDASNHIKIEIEDEKRYLNIQN